MRTAWQKFMDFVMFSCAMLVLWLIAKLVQEPFIAVFGTACLIVIVIQLKGILLSLEAIRNAADRPETGVIRAASGTSSSQLNAAPASDWQKLILWWLAIAIGLCAIAALVNYATNS